MTILKFEIFDFDQTLTKKHTIAYPALEVASNIKEGLRVKHDQTQAAAIATFHNNPTLVKTYVEKILNKELIFHETIYPGNNPKALIAVNSYQIAGENSFFLISYIPKTGNEYRAVLNRVVDKNAQIAFLLSLVEKQLSKDVVINFYDDSEDNCISAMGFFQDKFNIHSYVVNAYTDQFAIRNHIIPRSLADEPQIEEKQKKSDKSSFFASEEKKKKNKEVVSCSEENLSF